MLPDQYSNKSERQANKDATALAIAILAREKSRQLPGARSTVFMRN